MPSRQAQEGLQMLAALQGIEQQEAQTSGLLQNQEQSVGMHPLKMQQIESQIRNSGINSQAFQDQNARSEDLHAGNVLKQNMQNEYASQQEIDRAAMSQASQAQVGAQTQNTMQSGRRAELNDPLQRQMLMEQIQQIISGNTINAAGIMNDEEARSNFEARGGFTKGFRQPISQEQIEQALRMIFSGQTDNPEVMEAANRSRTVSAILNDPNRSR